MDLTVDRMDLPPLATATISALAEVVTHPPSSPVLLCSGPAASPAADQLARGLAAAVGAGESDIVVAHPDGASWKVAELDEQVLAPSHRSTATRNVVVVHAADRLVVGADRLLKTLEEPDAPTWFVLAAADVDRLPVTLRSRAAVEVVALPADDDTRTLRLIAAGVDADVAAALVAAAGPQVVFDLAACADPELAGELTELLDPPLPAGPRPVGSTVELAGRVERIGTQLAAVAGTPAASRVLLARRVLDAWRGQVAATLPSASSREDYAAVTARLEAVAGGHRLLERNLPPAQVLAVVAAGVALAAR